MKNKKLNLIMMGLLIGALVNAFLKHEMAFLGLGSFGRVLASTLLLCAVICAMVVSGKLSLARGDDSPETVALVGGLVLFLFVYLYLYLGHKLNITILARVVIAGIFSTAPFGAVLIFAKLANMIEKKRRKR